MADAGAFRAPGAEERITCSLESLAGAVRVVALLLVPVQLPTLEAAGDGSVRAARLHRLRSGRSVLPVTAVAGSGVLDCRRRPNPLSERPIGDVGVAPDAKRTQQSA